MPTDNPYFAHILARQLMDTHHRASFEAPNRNQARSVGQRSTILRRLRRAAWRTP